MEKAFQNPNTRKQRNNSIVPMDRGVDNSFKGYGLSKIDVYTKNAIKARQLQRFEVPNYTTTERDGMQAQKGKLIYNSTTDALNYYDGTTWQVLGAGGVGETNTASNVGTGGVGLYKQKTGVDLEFKNINAGSSKVSISNDAGNNEVDIDVDESNFDGSLITSVNASQLGGQGGSYYLSRTNHTGTQTASTISDFDTEVSNNVDVSTNTLKRHDAMTVVDGTTIDFTLAGQVLSGEVIEGAIDHDNLFNTHNLTTDIDHTAIQNIGTNTHAQIDTHIASTANPHSVDIDDVTPTTTKGDLIVENGSNAVRLPIGTDTHVLTADSAEATGVKWAAAGAGSNDKVGVDSAATPGYIGAANNDGVLRTDATIDYTDGGDYVTLSCNTGIADDDIVQIDSASVADNEYARFTANGLESRSTDEVLTDLDPVRFLGSASKTSSQSGITTLTDLTGLSVTVTVPTGGGTIRIVGSVPHMYSSVASDRMNFRIREGSTTLSKNYQNTGPTAGGGGGLASTVRYIGTATAGSHTYKLSLARGVGSGSLTVYGASDAPGYITVEFLST